MISPQRPDPCRHSETMTRACVHPGDAECTPWHLSNTGRSAAADPTSAAINRMVAPSMARSGRTPLLGVLVDRIGINDNQV
ncbi:hypothetical protein [Nonomuraea africana]|uniref:hypothetical protein n=1 Tax=Nonomuraea africana TaxID=46171 RepID=UPI0017893167|nr:hypothetical protein [Nonomuraea africana]